MSELGAGLILGPRPERKHCVASRRHADCEQTVAPKTGPLLEHFLQRGLLKKLLAGRTRQHVDENVQHEGTRLYASIGKVLGCLGDPLSPLGRKQARLDPRRWSPIWLHFGYSKEPNGATLATTSVLIQNQLKADGKVVARWSPALLGFLRCSWNC